MYISRSHSNTKGQAMAINCNVTLNAFDALIAVYPLLRL